MGKTITIRCRNTGSTHAVPLGSTLEEIYALLNLNMPYGTTSAKVNNRVEGLHFALFSSKDVEFLDVTSSSGMRTYTRSLFFVLYKAVHDVCPKAHLRISTSVAKGYACDLDVEGGITPELVGRLKARMQEIVDAHIPFKRHTRPAEEAAELFRADGLEDKAKLIESCGELYTTYYTLDGLADYFYGSLLVNTAQLRLFDLTTYDGSLFLRVPSSANPTELLPIVEQQKMFDVFREHHRWQQILGVNNVGVLNRAFELGYADDLINVSEALQEKKISQIADRIAATPSVRIVLIAGPSSSGKTTFSKRLSVQLMAAGVHPVPLSLDDYFVDRTTTPRLPNGEYDYESIHALNLPLLNDHLNALLAGEEVELPKYDFKSGVNSPSGKRLRLAPGTLLVVEGIHALNPMLTEHIPAEAKFKIYASALTSILLDDHNYIPTTDNRLLRRIVRDFRYRGRSARETIRQWPAVREGEEKWIFPYQEEADVMMNTALLFELAVLRPNALPLLEQVPENTPEYSEAHRLCKFLRYVHPLPNDSLPPTSLLREFLGGSTFKY